MGYICAADPGKKGAFAIITTDAELIDIIDMPILGDELNIKSIIEFLTKHQSKINRFYLEKAMAGFQQSSTSTLTTGINYGILLGIITIMKISFEEVQPSVWKRKMGITVKGKDLTEGKKEKKELAIHTAITMFSGADKYIYLKKHDGRADALLLAEYGRLKFLGQK